MNGIISSGFSLLRLLLGGWWANFRSRLRRPPAKSNEGSAMTADPRNGVVVATGDLFPTVPNLETSKGVAMNPPPAAILSTVNQMVADSVKTLPAGATGALVGIATKNAAGEINVNLALTKKVRENVTVIGWLGKSWGVPIEGGAAVQIVF